MSTSRSGLRPKDKTPAVYEGFLDEDCTSPPSKPQNLMFPDAPSPQLLTTVVNSVTRRSASRTHLTQIGDLVRSITSFAERERHRPRSTNCARASGLAEGDWRQAVRILFK